MGHIAFAMAVVVATSGGFGPRTRDLAHEAIAHWLERSPQISRIPVPECPGHRKALQLIRAISL
jgi:molybdopterin-biosynthesis enzyme MoeA-like protein